MGIGCDDGARVLGFCTIASRGIHSIQVKRQAIDLSQGRHPRTDFWKTDYESHILRQGSTLTPYRHTYGSIRNSAMVLLLEPLIQPAIELL